MKKKIVNILLVLFASVNALLCFGQSANNTVKQHTLTVGDFNRLSVNTSIAVDYRCVADSAGLAVFTVAENNVEDILFSNNGKGSLTIDLDFDYDYRAGVPRITVYSSGLERIANNGDSLVRATGLPPVEKFNVVLIGNGQLMVDNIQADKVDASIRSGHGLIELSGRTKELKAAVVGTGIIDALELPAINVTASMVGTGKILCAPEYELLIRGMGTGVVLYPRAPAVVRSRAAGVKHRCVER